MLTLKALGENIQGEMWEILFPNETFSQDKFKFIRDNTTSYLILENATNNNNKAETALLSISLLQDEIGLYKEMYQLLYGLKRFKHNWFRKLCKKLCFRRKFWLFIKMKKYVKYNDKDLIEVFLDKIID